ncbi:hypothetical protein [Thalassobaculum litoreum]|uniref:hypothetical protein n=1 Tax=Thalassobaculum litoreum TaxID=420996 RepID=UPI0011137B93|nr:hypothetical protein [Thalassobaculum litoreum]
MPNNGSWLPYRFVACVALLAAAIRKTTSIGGHDGYIAGKLVDAGYFWPVALFDVGWIVAVVAVAIRIARFGTEPRTRA